MPVWMILKNTNLRFPKQTSEFIHMPVEINGLQKSQPIISVFDSVMLMQHQTIETIKNIRKYLCYDHLGVRCCCVPCMDYYELNFVYILLIIGSGKLYHVLGTWLRLLRFYYFGKVSFYLFVECGLSLSCLSVSFFVCFLFLAP